MRGQSGDKSKTRLQAQVCSGRARTLLRQTHWSLRSARHGRKTTGLPRERVEVTGKTREAGRTPRAPVPQLGQGNRGEHQELPRVPASKVSKSPDKRQRSTQPSSVQSRSSPLSKTACSPRWSFPRSHWKPCFPPPVSLQHFSEAPSLSETCLWQSPLSVPIFLSLETVHSLNLQACS